MFSYKSYKGGFADALLDEYTEQQLNSSATETENKLDLRDNSELIFFPHFLPNCLSSCDLVFLFPWAHFPVLEEASKNITIGITYSSWLKAPYNKSSKRAPVFFFVSEKCKRWKHWNVYEHTDPSQLMWFCKTHCCPHNFHTKLLGKSFLFKNHRFRDLLKHFVL